MWHVACRGERSGAYRVLVRKSEGQRPLGRSRHRWEENIRRDLKKVGWESTDLIGLPQDRDRRQALVNMVNELEGSI